MEKCNKCGKDLIEMQPDYIPLGLNSIAKIVDYTCSDCGGVYCLGNNVRKIIENQELHDKLLVAMGWQK